MLPNLRRKVPGRDQLCVAAPELAILAAARAGSSLDYFLFARADLSEPIDVFCDWVDECEASNFAGAPGADEEEA